MSSTYPHIIVSHQGLPIYNQLIGKGEEPIDIIQKFKPESYLEQEYRIERWLKSIEVQDNTCFHISMDLTFKNGGFNINIPPVISGINLYYFISQLAILKDKKIYFIFYSFMSKEQIFLNFPKYRPDIEYNNFFQYPLDPNYIKDLQLYVPYKPEAINLLRGSFLSTDLISDIVQNKTILIIDDEIERMETIYQRLFGCELICFKQSKSEFYDITTTSKNIADFIGSKNIDLIISDLYLSEDHIEYQSNLRNSADVSGYKLHNDYLSKLPKFANCPLIFLTSSTKIWNYQNLSTIPNFKAWTPKPVNIDIHDDKGLILAHYHSLYTAIKSAWND